MSRNQRAVLYIANPQPSSPRWVACPRCGAAPKYACRRMSGTVHAGEALTYHHPERRRAVKPDGAE